MSLRGSLIEVNLADICQLLAMGRKTGCLWVTDRSNFGYVYFKNGRVTYATVLNRPDRLGETLVQNGVISREALSRAMERQAREPGARVGRVLVEQGSLKEDALEQYCSVQISEAVYQLFTWVQGSFHFDPDVEPEDQDAILVSINAESLLLEGARRVDEWSLIEKKIPSFDLIFSLNHSPEGEEVELTSEQKKVLEVLDGKRCVADVVRVSGLVEFDVGKALYGLLQAGFVEQTGRKDGGVPETTDHKAQRHVNLGLAFHRAGMFEEAAREFRRVIELDPGSVPARKHLGLIALEAGRPEEFLEHSAAMPEETRGTYGSVRNRALAHELTGDFDQALSLLQQAESARPDDPDILLTRGIVYLKAGDAVQASDALQRFRDRCTSSPPPAIYYAYGVLAAAMEGRDDAAVRLGREGLSHYPESGPILVNTGAVLERRGEPEAAEAFYLRAVSHPPPPAQAHKNLGDLALVRGDQAGAQAHYERAVRIDPHLGDDVYAKLGTLANEEADRTRALELWRKALELNPNNEVALASAGHVGSGRH